MQIQFQEAVSEKVKLEEDIIVADLKVGTVVKSYCDHRKCDRFMAIIKIEGVDVIGGSSLYGHGYTREDAVTNAIDSSRKNYILLLKKVDELEQKIKGGE